MKLYIPYFICCISHFQVTYCCSITDDQDIYIIIFYFLAQFEGSLGRLTTSSVHNPRQIIDLHAHDIHDEGQGQSANKDLRKARQLLMEIEKVKFYMPLLSIQKI